MPATSEARIEANRKNAAKSTGPKTPEGKERSRANALKHGMTGDGVVVPDSDASEIERRTESLRAELDPKSTLGQALVGQIALMSVRMERAASREEQALASRVRRSSVDFDHDRVDRVEALFDALADDPRKNLRLLRRSPEGIDRLVEAWLELRDMITQPGRNGWDEPGRELAARMLGRRPDQARGTRIDRLAMAARGEASLPDPEWLALDFPARRAWAFERLVEEIDEQIAELEAHFETLDLELIRLDRLGAADLALFDSSREATLARRYESEAHRNFYKALNEFRRAEAEFAATDRPSPRPASRPVPLAQPQPVRTPRPVVAAEPPLASSREMPLAASRGAMPTTRDGSDWPDLPFDGAARGLDGAGPGDRTGRGGDPLNSGKWIGGIGVRAERAARGASRSRGMGPKRRPAGLFWLPLPLEEG